MKILLIGRNGQVGFELERSLQGLGEIVAVGRTQLDLENLDSLRAGILSIRPELIINAAAYTAVDKAEQEPDLAMRINGEAPGVMAQTAKQLGAGLIHYSTDYVFDGTKTSPYVEDDQPCPINVYGSTKLAGECAIQDAGGAYLIFRTSWVYGTRGRNFLQTVLRLAGERDEIRMVDDQRGSPTWCRSVSDVTAHVVARLGAAAARDQWWATHGGIYHLTGQGETTWYHFAREILALSGSAGVRVLPIAAREYPTPAKRPAYSVLCGDRLAGAFGRLPDWQTSLRLCLERG